MVFIKKIGKTGFIFLVSQALFAQTNDSIPQKVMEVVTDKFPITRVLNIEYSQNTPYDYTSKLNEVDLPEGKVNNMFQFRTSANINFIKKPKWMLGTIVNYRYISTDIDNPDWTTGIVNNRKVDFHYHFTALNFTYFSSLFNKMVIYSGSISVDGSQHSFEKVRGMATAIMVLKANATTKMTFGVIGLIDKNLPTPAIVSFTYEHKFQNGLIADVYFPKGAFIRKNVFNDGRISLGTELDNTNFYLYNLDNSGKTYSFSQLELNSGLIYEHNLGSSFIATFKSGLKTVAMSRISDKNKSTKDYIFKSSADPSFYFNVGVSFNPFEKKKSF